MNLIKKIIIVDDDGIVNYVTEKLLHHYNNTYEINTYTNPLNALENLQLKDKYHEDLPDLIFLDINMPQISGYEFLNRMTESKLAHKIQVIMFTSSGSPNDIKLSKSYRNVIGYMEKPFSSDAYERVLEMSYN